MTQQVRQERGKHGKLGISDGTKSLPEEAQ